MTLLFLGCATTRISHKDNQFTIVFVVVAFTCLVLFLLVYVVNLCWKPYPHPSPNHQLYHKTFLVVKSCLRVASYLCGIWWLRLFSTTFSSFFLANPERFVQLIRRDYKSAVLCPFPWCEDELQFKLANIFTRLRIVSETRERSKLTDDVVNMTDVFRPHAECENPRVVLVEGNPAMGKTTYCQKLAHDWSLSRIPEDSSFPKVEILLLLKCRDMNARLADIELIID